MVTALGHGLWSFLKHYIFKLGFIDGWAGFVIAFGNFEGTYYRYAKRYEETQNWIAAAEQAAAAGGEILTPRHHTGLAQIFLQEPHARARLG